MEGDGILSLQRRRRFQHRVGVGAAEAEAVDPDHRRAALRLQVQTRRVQLQVQVAERDGRVRRRAMQRRRHPPGPERQHRLQQPGHAARRLQVADVGFDRSDGQRPGPAGAQRLPQRRGLDRVAGRGARAVRLHVVQVLRINAEAAIHLVQQRRLRRRVGQGEPVGPPVRIHAGPAHHGMDRVAVGQRRPQRLQHQHRPALSPHIAVRPRIEGMAPPARRQHGRRAKPYEVLRRQQQVDPAHQRHRRLPGPQRLARLVQRHQRRGARGVHRERRPPKVEGVADPVGQGAQRCPRHRVGVHHRGIAHVQRRVVPGGPADIDAHCRPRELAGVQPRILQRLVRQLQQQALLRVHLRRLPRGDAEEAGIKPADIPQHARRERIGLAPLPPVRMQVGRLGPAVVRDLRHRVHPGRQQLREGLHVRGARQAARRADDGDGLVPGKKVGVRFNAAVQCRTSVRRGRHRSWGVKTLYGDWPGWANGPAGASKAGRAGQPAAIAAAAA